MARQGIGKGRKAKAGKWRSKGGKRQWRGHRRQSSRGERRGKGGTKQGKARQGGAMKMTARQWG